MTDATTAQPNQTTAGARDDQASDAKSHRVTAVAWLAGITAVVALGTMSTNDSLGSGMAIAAIAAMVTAVSYFILKSCPCRNFPCGGRKFDKSKSYWTKLFAKGH